MTEESQYELDSHRRRVYDQLDRLEDRSTRTEARLAVIEAKQIKVDDIAQDVAAIRDAVIGIPEHPDTGLVGQLAQVNRRVVVIEQTEVAEHGILRALVVGTPIAVGVVGLGLKLLEVW